MNLPLRSSDNQPLSNLQEDVRQALNEINRLKATQSSLGYLAIVQTLCKTDDCTEREATKTILDSGLTDMADTYPDLVRLLRLRFFDNQITDMAANNLGIAPSTAYVWQREAITKLAGFIHQKEVKNRQSQSADYISRLESPTYTNLIGIDTATEALWPLLTKSETPWIISIEGLGGIGKTSLADALVRRIINEAAFAGIAWVTARQEYLGADSTIRPTNQLALRKDALITKLLEQLLDKNSNDIKWSDSEKLSKLRDLLRTQPHLIVIDNLETVPDVEHLLPVLRNLYAPTKFLITSRERFESSVGVYHYNLPELNQKDTLQLVRQEAQERNLSHLIEATDTELENIYKTVGGNPLAIRLIVGQTHFHSLQLILDNFKEWRSAQADNFYEFIYQWAWERLDETARMVWMQLPLVDERMATLDYLTMVIDIEPPLLETALATLVQLNLVMCQGGLNERRYLLHNLTRTFLLTEIAQWQ